MYPSKLFRYTEKIRYFNNHPGIKTIKEKFRKSFSFKFKFVSADKILRYINEIDIKKSSSREISPVIIKLAKKFCNQSQTVLINVFQQNQQKVADVIPVFKKEDPNNKANY